MLWWMQAEKAGDAKVDDASARKIPVGFLSSNKDSWLQLFLNKYLFSVVYSLPGKIVIVGIVICGVILGAIGIVRPPPLFWHTPRLPA